MDNLLHTFQLIFVRIFYIPNTLFLIIFVRNSSSGLCLLDLTSYVINTGTSLVSNCCINGIELDDDRPALIGIGKEFGFNDLTVRLEPSINTLG